MATIRHADRGYDALMRLLYAGVHSGDLGSMMGLGKSLLASMDTNLNVMTAITLASATFKTAMTAANWFCLSLNVHQ